MRPTHTPFPALGAALAVLIVCMAAAPALAAPVGVLGFSYDDGRRQISIGLDGAVTVRTQRLSNPERLIIDLREARLPIASTPIAVRSAKIRAIRISQQSASPAVVRVLVDLAPGFEPMVTVSQLNGKLQVKLADPAPAQGERDLESLPGLPPSELAAERPAAERSVVARPSVPDAPLPAVTRLPAPPAQNVPQPPPLPQAPAPARRPPVPKPTWTPPPTPGWVPKSSATPPPENAPFGVPGYGTPVYGTPVSGVPAPGPAEPRPPAAAASGPKASRSPAPLASTPAPSRPAAPMGARPAAPSPATPAGPGSAGVVSVASGPARGLAPTPTPEPQEELPSGTSVLPPDRQPKASLGSSFQLRWQQIETLEEYGAPEPSFAYPTGINGFDLEHWFMPFLGAGLDARVLIYDLTVESIRQHRTDTALGSYLALRYPLGFLEPSLRAGYMGRSVAVESESTGTSFPFSPVQTYYGPTLGGRLKVAILPGFGLDLHGKFLPGMQGSLYPGFPAIFPLSGQGWGASLVTDIMRGYVSLGYTSEKAASSDASFTQTFSGISLGMGFRY